jgi:alginate O-acetyltransferase complex protein AlgI
MSEYNIDLTYSIPIMLVLYWATSRKVGLNNILLLIFGFLLYSWGHPLWGLLLAILTALNYLSIRLYFRKNNKLILIFALLMNIAAWLLCKYYASWGKWLGVSFGFPLGISFYILRILAYLLDSYKGKIREPLGFVPYALYISYFPQIYSGPIESPDDFLSQIEKPRRLTREMISKAVPLLLMGVFKKIVIADNLGMIVDRIFRLDYPSRLMLAAGSFGYTFEIYADFLSYTDLSRGFSYLLGIETSQNFNQPYAALTPQDFWNRWHMTFSKWLRDYIFYPLRRWLLSGVGASRWLVDLLTPIATMLVSGFWHGTGWTYLIWGLFYGLLLALYQLLGLNRLAVRNTFTKIISWMMMFGFTVTAWMIFRAPSLGWIVQVIRTSPWGGSGNQLIALLGVMTMILMYISPLLIYFGVEHSGKARTYLKPVFYALAVVVLIIFAASGLQDFVYTTF